MRKRNKQIILCVLFSAIFCGIPQTFSPLAAQEATLKLSEEHQELWRAAIKSYEEGEFCVQDKKYTEAIKHFKSSLDAFKKVRDANPTWNRNVVSYRIGLIERKIRNTQDKLEDQNKRTADATKNLTPSATSKPAASSAASGDTLEVAALKKALDEAKAELNSLRSDAAKGRNSAAELQALLKEKDAIASRLTTLTLQYNELKRKSESSENTSEIEKALSSEKKRSEILEKTAAAVKEENITLLKQIQALSASMLELEKDSKELARKALAVTDIEKNAAIMRDRAAELTNELKSVNEKNAADMKKINSDLAAKTRECEELTESVRKLRAGMQLDAAARGLEGENVRIKTENEQLKNTVTLLTNELAKLKEKSTKELDDATHRDTILKSLSDKNNAMTAEMTKLSRDLENSRKELVEKTKALNNASKETERLNKELNTFASKINSRAVLPPETDPVGVKLREELTKTASELEKLKETSAKLDAEKKNLELANAENLKALSSLKKSADENVKALADADKRLKNVKNESDKTAEIFEKANMNLANELDMLRKKYADLEKTSLQNTRDSKNAVSDATKELSNKITTLEKNAQDSAKNITALNKVSEELAAERNTLRKQLDEQGKMISEMKGRLSRADEIIQSEALLDATIKENKLLQARYDKLLQEKSNPAAEKEVAALKAKLEASEKLSDAAKEKIISLEKNIDDLKKTMSIRAEADRKALESVKKEMEALAKANTESKGKNDAAEKIQNVEFEKLSARLADAEKKLNDAQKESNSTIENLAKEKNIVSAKLADSEKALAKANSEIADLKKKISEKAPVATPVTTADNNSETAKQLEILSREFAESEKRNDKLLKQLEDTRKQTAVLVGSETQKVVERKDREIAMLANSLEELKNNTKKNSELELAKTKELASALEKSQNEIANLKKDLEKAVAAAVPPVASDNAELAAKMTELEKELARIKDERAVYANELDKTRRDLTSTKTKLDAAQKAASDRSEVDALKGELAKARKTIEAYEAAAKSDTITTELRARITDMEKTLDEATRKITRQTAEIRSFEAGVESVVANRLAKKDEAIEALMKEHVGMLEEIKNLKSALKNVSEKAAEKNIKLDPSIEKLLSKGE